MSDRQRPVARLARAGRTGGSSARAVSAPDLAQNSGSVDAVEGGRPARASSAGISSSTFTKDFFSGGMQAKTKRMEGPHGTARRPRYGKHAPTTPASPRATSTSSRPSTHCPLTAGQLLKLSQTFACPFTTSAEVRATPAAARGLRPGAALADLRRSPAAAAPDYYTLSPPGLPAALRGRGASRRPGVPSRRSASPTSGTHTPSPSSSSIPRVGPPRRHRLHRLLAREHAAPAESARRPLYPDCTFRCGRRTGRPPFHFLVELDNPPSGSASKGRRQLAPQDPAL